MVGKIGGCLLLALWLLPGVSPAGEFKLCNRLRDSDLVENGAPRAAIVAPAELRPETEAIQAAVKERTGVVLPILNDKGVLDLLRDRRNLIILGSRDNNRLTAELYDRYMIILDADYPGAGGYLVRSAPHPAATDRNLIFAGGSDPAGNHAAAEALAAAIRRLPVGRTLTLPWQWQLKPGPAFKVVQPEQAGSVPLWQEVNGYYGNQGYFGWNVVSRLMALFYLTGDERYAAEFVRLALPDEQAVAELRKSVGETIENPRRPLAGSYHYTAHLMAVYWNLIEDHPFFTPELRRRIVGEFFAQYEYLRDAKEANYRIAEIVKPLPAMPDRHVMYCALTLFTLCRYLNLYYPAPEFDAGLKTAGFVFGPLERDLYVIGEGGVHYWLTTTTLPLLDWALLSGAQHRIPHRVFELAEEKIETLASGNPRDLFLAFGSMSFYRKLYYLSGRPGALAMCRSLRMDDRQTRLGRSYRPPTEPAAAALPQGAWQEGYLSIAERAGQRADFPPERSFSFLSFRQDGDFMLLDGRFESVTRSPYHCLAWLRLNLAGVPLLSGYRNQLFVSSNGMVDKKAARFAERLYTSVLGDSASFGGRIGNFNSVDFTRQIIMRRGRYALTVDTVTPCENSAALGLKFSWELPKDNRLDKVEPGLAVFSAAGSETAGLRLDKQSLQLEPKDRIIDRRPLSPAFLPARNGDELTATFTLDISYRGQFAVSVRRARNAGYLELALDGRPMGGKVDCHATETEAERVWCGDVELAPGRHVLTLRAAGEVIPGAGQAVGLQGIEILASTDLRQYAIGFADAVPTRVRTSADDFFNGGSGRLLEMILHKPAQKGEKQYYFTLVAPFAGPGRNCLRLTPNAALVFLPEPALAVVGTYADMEGELLVAGTDHLYGRGVKRIGRLLQAEPAVEADWNFKTGRLMVRGDAPTRLRLNGEDAARALPNGIHSLEVEPKRELLPAIPSPEAWPRHDEKQAAGPTAAEAAKVLNTVWRRKLDGFPVALEFLNGMLLTVIGNEVMLLDLGTGKVRRHWTESSPVTALHAWRGLGLIAVGTLDCQVKVYAPDGSLRWTFASEPAPQLLTTGKTYWYRTAPGLRGIRGFGSGIFRGRAEQLFVGSASTVEILNADGTLDRRVRQWWGPCSQFTMIDRPDGSPAMLVGRNHNGFHHLGILEAADPQFDRKGFWENTDPANQIIGWMGIVRNHIFYQDLEGRGEKWVISDLTGLNNSLVIWSRAGKALYDVNFGPGERSPLATDRPVFQERALRDFDIADLDGDGKQELCLITDKQLLLIFDARLQLRRCCPLPGDPILLAAGPGRLVTVLRDGTVWLLDPQGGTVAAGRVEGMPFLIARCDDTVIVATNHELACFSISSIQ